LDGCIVVPVAWEARKPPVMEASGGGTSSGYGGSFEDPLHFSLPY